MSDELQVKSPTAPRSVQHYLDETPLWADGTPVEGAPMTAMQRRIFALAAAGKFFEGMIVFMTGVALPLIAREFGLGAAGHGMVAAASLAGILIGATCLGGLADHFGRRRMFIVEMVVLLVFLTIVCVSPSFPILLIGLVGIGIALGCDYPTAHLVISETIASRTRGRLVLGAFAFQAVGALFGTAVGYAILVNFQEVEAWRLMYATALLPAAIVLAARFTIPDSPHYLFLRGESAKAEASLARLLERSPPYPKVVRLEEPPRRERSGPGWLALFGKKYRRATILASVPWFLQDLGTYGIGIFTPIILATALGQKAEHAVSVAAIVENDILAAKGAAIIDILLVIGVGLAVLFSDRLGRMPLQIAGFIGCAVGLLLAAGSSAVAGATATVLVFAGFMVFNLSTNIGPNAQTYVIAGELFPTEIRARGAGFAASFAKMGAVLTAFLFPLLLVHLGTTTLLLGLVATSLLGAAVTFVFRMETAGLDLETLGQNGSQDPTPEPAARPAGATGR